MSGLEGSGLRIEMLLVHKAGALRGSARDEGRTQWSGRAPSQLRRSSQVHGLDIEMSELRSGLPLPGRAGLMDRAW